MKLSEHQRTRLFITAITLVICSQMTIDPIKTLLILLAIVFLFFFILTKKPDNDTNE